MFESSRNPRKNNPRQGANFFSRLSFLYTREIFTKSHHKDLEEEDIYTVVNNCRSDVVGDVLETEWNIELKKQDASLTKTLVRIFGWEYALYGLLNFIIQTPLLAVSPYATGTLVSYFEPSSTTTQNKAIFSGCILIASGLLSAIYTNYYNFAVQRLALRIEISVCALVYRKALKLTEGALSAVTSGKVMTLIAKDALLASSGSLLFMHDIWIGVLQVIVVMGIMYHRVGSSTLVGIGFFMGVIPIQMWIGVKIKQLCIKTLALTDERLKRIQEILTSIRLIKLYTWETYFTKIIHSLRIKEMLKMRNALFLRAVILTISSLSYRISYFLCILAYYLLGNNISAEELFFLVTCYKTLDSLLSSAIPMNIAMLAEGKSAIERIRSYLLLEERATEAVTSAGIRVELDGVSVKVLDTLVLNEVSLELNQPLLVGITGEVGCGKSTLLKTVLKDINISTGAVIVRGDVSYASQEPWLFPGTIRQNILFGNSYDHARYHQVLKACALVEDLENLPEHDTTVVIDKGLNLSKGQQARINLARAVYKQADVYLLDDVLSSLDLNVSKHVFYNCIKGFLKGKLCLLTCHHADFLACADKLLSLQNGKIQIKDNGSNECCEYKSEDFPGENYQKVTTDGKLYKENKVCGKVHWRIYKKYYDFAGGWRIVPLVVLICLVAQSIGIVFDYYANQWLEIEAKMIETLHSKNATSVEPVLETERTRVLWFYGGILALFAVFTVVEHFSFLAMTVRAARNLHLAVFERIMGAEMSFFDANFSGSVVNRLSRDMSHVDGSEYLFFESVKTTIELAVSGFLIIYLNPLLSAPALLFFVAVLYAGMVFLKASRSLRRMEPMVRAPCIGYLNASLEGLTTIRASGKQEILKAQFDRHQNHYSSVVYMIFTTKSAFGLFLSVIGNLFSACIIFSFIMYHDKIENIAGDVGVAVTQAIGISSLLQSCVTVWAEVENSMTAVERVLEYGDAEQETISGDSPPNWPTDAKIEFKNVSLNYPNSKNSALRGVTFTIEPKQKIGIIGRTGAGKSSIISALFHLYPSEGSIFIDNADVSKIKLATLRSKISIIPQDPVMFNGTVRSNLDPHGHYSDFELWSALDRVGLTNAGLADEVREGGLNWSVGQRQLFSLARVILANNKIVVLDEPTANMDPETDFFVRKAVKELFADCIVITIAHRVNTVLSSDKIMVVQAGEIVQYETTEEMLKSPRGYLNSILK